MYYSDMDAITYKIEVLQDLGLLKKKSFKEVFVREILATCKTFEELDRKLYKVVRFQETLDEFLLRHGYCVEFGTKISDKQWNTFVSQLVRDGINILYFPPVDEQGNTIFEKYIYVSLRNKIYYIEDEEKGRGLTCIEFEKVNPTEIKQKRKPIYFRDYDKLLRYMKEFRPDILKDSVNKIQLYPELRELKNGHSTFWSIRNMLVGFEERDILGELERIEMVKHTRDHCIFKFISFTDETFCFDTKNMKEVKEVVL